MKALRTCLPLLLLFPVFLAAQQLGPGVPLIDLEPGTPSFDQDLRGVASDGTEFLAVWNEQKTPGAPSTIRLGRFGRDQRLLDPYGHTLMESGLAKRLVWTGEHWLLIWHRDRTLFTSLVARDLSVLETNTIATENVDRVTVRVGRGRIAVSYHGERGYVIVLLDTNGRRLGPIATRTQLSQSAVSFVAGHDTYLLIWGNAEGLFYAEYDQDLHELRSATISTARTLSLDATWARDAYLIAWMPRVDFKPGEIRPAQNTKTMRLTAAGVSELKDIPNSPNGAAIYSNGLNAILCVWKSTSGLLIAGNTSTADLYAQRLDLLGNPVGESFRVSRYSGQNWVADVVNDGPDYLFAWYHIPSSLIDAPGSARAAFVTTTGSTHPDEFSLQSAIKRTTEVAMAANGTSRITVWRTAPPEKELSNVMYTVGDGVARRLNLNGAAWRTPEVIAGAGHYLVHWFEHGVGEQDSRLVSATALVRDDGHLVEKVRVESPAGTWWDGQSYVVISWEGSISRILSGGLAVPSGKLNFPIRRAGGMGSVAAALTERDLLLIDVSGSEPRILSSTRHGLTHPSEASIAANGSTFLIAAQENAEVVWQVYGADGVPRGPAGRTPMSLNALKAMPIGSDWLITGSFSRARVIRVVGDNTRYDVFPMIGTPTDWPAFPTIAVADGKAWLLDPRTEWQPPMNGGNQWYQHELFLDTGIPRRRSLSGK